MLASLTNLHSALSATADYPATTVPLGLRAEGMPVGVTFIGKPGTDGRMLGFAYAFEQAPGAGAAEAVGVGAGG